MISSPFGITPTTVVADAADPDRAVDDRGIAAEAAIARGDG